MLVRDVRDCDHACIGESQNLYVVDAYKDDENAMP